MRVVVATGWLLASGMIVSSLLAGPALAQPATMSAVNGVGEAGATNPGAYNQLSELIVTAQRQSQSLGDVPIAITAFTAQALQARQIHDASDLQLSMPNVTFSKGNFATASFTIRGVGDLCVGFSCDTATGIHVNDMPLLTTRLFETEYLDLERIEVLRGPQGTLYGRNATSGVINFITARPDLTGAHAEVGAEYGNYRSLRTTAMLNLPVGETLGLRVAGNYLGRGGFTKNLYDGSHIDGRRQYSVRGTLRWKPSPDTTIDLIGSYFNENDDRSRIQKQLCHRDPTAILGCLPDRLANGTVNGNATLGSLFNSRQFIALALSPQLAGFGLTDLYGQDSYRGAINPAGIRTVAVDTLPTYRASEQQFQARIEQGLGERLKLTVIGGYTRNKVDSTTDFTLSVDDPYAANPIARTALAQLDAVRGLPAFANFAAAIIPNGPAGVCVSQANRNFVGIFGGQVAACAANQIAFDRSDVDARQWSVEGHVDTDFDGRFNFLFGAVYVDGTQTGDYFVNATGLDYGAGLIGAAATNGVAFQASPYFDNLTDDFHLKSYGIFGETYVTATDRLNLTLGLRYSHDRKRVADANFLYNTGLLVPYGTTDVLTSPFLANADADPKLAGNQPFRTTSVGYGRLTGRAVVDYTVGDGRMIYASYSRGYKSGGINPPFDPTQFTAPATFSPETIDAFEVGSKNIFAGGAVRLNASLFYYKYKDLQIGRILARTSFNDNTDADIYGAEAEAVVAPTPALVFNVQFSFLKTKIKELSLIDTRDPSGGRSDTVIVKDITSASNCVVEPTVAGNAVGANTLVAAFNAAIGLAPPVPVPATNTTGAFSVCSALAATIQNPPSALRALFATPAGPLPFVFRTDAAGVANGLPDGIAVDLRGNQLPNAPKFKVGVGAQYSFALAGGVTLVPRIDVNFTGATYARTFNRPIDRIPSYRQIDLQLTLNGRDGRWFARGFVQNLENRNSITGEYLTDASSGLFTNVFSLEPRRFGAGVGVRF